MLIYDKMMFSPANLGVYVILITWYPNANLEENIPSDLIGPFCTKLF